MINPRLSLVWTVSPSLTAKLLYGRAFLAPSFTELYGNNAIAVVGNSHLKPETLNMVEFALDKRWSSSLWTGINLFGYETANTIVTATHAETPASPTRYINSQGTRGHGLELEARYQLTRQINLSANYAWQTAEGDDPYQVDLTPRHQMYGEITWQVTPSWSFNSHWKWIGQRQGLSGHEHHHISPYLLGGITLLRADPRDQWDFSVAINNLLDADAREPATFPAALPDDIPLPGRNIIAQAKWRF